MKIAAWTEMRGLRKTDKEENARERERERE